SELVQTLEGLPVYAIYHRSSGTRWSVAIGVPQESIEAPLRRSLLLNIAATVALFGIGVLIASLAGRRIALSLSRLAPLAEAIGRNEPLPTPALSIAEAARAAEALRMAGTELQQSRAARDRATEELREINLTLEQRVDERTAALRHSRQLLDAIVENLPATVVVKRAGDLSFEYFNRAAETFLRAPRQSYYGKTDHDLFPPELAVELEAQDRRVLESGRVEASVERELPTPHGDTRVLRVTKVPLSDDSGQPTRLMAIGLDVTDAKRAEDQLRIVATAFDSQEAMMITDAQRRILRVNRAFTQVTGYAADEVVGREPRLLGSGRHDSVFFADVWRSIASAGSWQGELWNRRKSGEEYPCWTTITAIQDDSGKVTNYVGVHTDISAQKRVEDEIRQLAFYDPLTGLPNRRLLMDRLHHAVVQSSRSGKKGALMFIDLDNFKTLNDTLGHDKGDELLRQVAMRLPMCVREGDTVARLGGDEFVVMLEDLDPDFERSAVMAEAVGQKVLERLNLPYTLGGHQYRSTPSVGVALFGNHHNDIDELLKRADLAMYEAKGAGRNAIRFFEPRMQTLVAAHAALEHELRLAVLQQDFVLHFQPQVNLKGDVVGAEALLRWNQGGQGLVLPEQFITLAEETGLILPIGRWAMHAACSQLVQWSRQPHMAHLHMSVNVSARQIQQPDFVDEVMRVIAATGAPAHLITLELTESSLLHGFTEIAEKIIAFKERGIAVALDDFGVGYSSLTYLRRLPIDELKIDRSFVHNVATDANDAAIVRTIIALTKALELKVIAEGVEDTDQRDFLAYHGCTLFQGFYFGSPISAEELSERLRPALPQPETEPASI
ncbi:MAG TPA: EAL domain-containing protein, partial [Telluria sp.]|nr:EAL domain-containing protein [Telluria sp.]